MKNLLFLVICLGGVYAEFIKSENIVFDSTQNLMWQDDIETTNKEDIILAITYCEELVLNGYIDWELPSIKQLQSLIDQNQKEGYLQKSFMFSKNDKYWSNTQNVNNKEQYWYVDFQTGKVSFDEKKSLNYLRCVREKN